MGKTFDKIDIILIILISIYLLALVIGLLWIILDKIEKKSKSILSRKDNIIKVEAKIVVKNNHKPKATLFPFRKMTEDIKEKVTETITNKENNSLNKNGNKQNVPISKTKVAEVKKKPNSKTQNDKNKSPKPKVSSPKTKTNTTKTNKTKNNSSNRANGYVSPTKRKKNTKTKKKKNNSKNKKSTKKR